MNRWYNNYRQALVFGGWGALGSVVGVLLIIGLEKPIDHLLGRLGNRDAIALALIFAIIGSCIAAALLAGYSTYMRRFRLLEFLKTALFGFFAGAVAGSVSGFVWGFGAAGPVRQSVVLIIAGSLLGLGLSYRIPNLGRWHGLTGGALGAAATALVGSLAPGRDSFVALAFALLGFFIGAALVFVEAAFREAWLEVRYGPKEIRNITLGLEPVSIGGDPDACTVYAKNAPAVAYRYKLDQGSITCEDVTKGQTTTVQPGTTQTIGNLTVTVRAAGAEAQAVSLTQTTARPAGGFSLRLSNGKILSLADGVNLSTTDIPGVQPSSPGGAVASIGRNPNDPNILGLKNLSRISWTATLASRDRIQVDPGKNVRVAAGTKISFGSIEGEIQT